MLSALPVKVRTSVQSRSSSPSASGAASASAIIVLLTNGSATTLANYFLLITEATIQTVSPSSLCWLRRSEVNHEHVAQWQAFSTWQRRRSRLHWNLHGGGLVQLRVHQRTEFLKKWTWPVWIYLGGAPTAILATIWLFFVFFLLNELFRRQPTTNPPIRAVGVWFVSRSDKVNGRDIFSPLVSLTQIVGPRRESIHFYINTLVFFYVQCFLQSVSNSPEGPSHLPLSHHICLFSPWFI